MTSGSSWSAADGSPDSIWDRIPMTLDMSLTVPSPCAGKLGNAHSLAHFLSDVEHPTRGSAPPSPLCGGYDGVKAKLVHGYRTYFS